MEDQDVVAVGWAGPVSPEAVPVLKPEVVEELLTRLGRGEKLKRLAAEYGVDRKTIRAWRARGRYQPRAPRPRTSMLDAHATWLTARAPEVDFNSAVLYRELVTHFGYAGSAQQVLRFVRPLRVAARQTRATARFRDRAGPAGASGLRPVPGLGWRCRGHGARLRVHVRLFTPHVRGGLSPRARERGARGPRARVPAFRWRAGAGRGGQRAPRRAAASAGG